MASRKGRTGQPIRGLLLDLARLTERHKFYFDLLPHLARWGFNTLWLHFVDDQGVVLRLDSHPELASRYALAKAEMRRLIRAAGRLGIDVVPEVESLGHARYITSLRRYAHLADGDPTFLNAVCPSHPQTIELLDDILTEVAELFDSPYVHAGLDEVDFGGCKRCARRGRGRPKWWIYAEHVKAVHRILASRGKRMIMWADHVEHAPAMLRALPKDIVMAHWHYRDVPTAGTRRSLRAGFDVILSPAICHWGNVVLSDEGNYANLDETLRVAASLPGRGAMGIVNTWWVPWRGLRDAYLPAVAYTGRVLRTGRPAGKPAFARQFAREHFGLRGRAAGEALWAVQAVPLATLELKALLPDSAADVFDAISLASAEGFAARVDAARQAADALDRAAAKVRSNRPHFEAIRLAGRIKAACLDNGLALAEFQALAAEAEVLRDREKPPAQVLAPLEKARGRLAELVRRLERVCKAAEKEWDRTRHRDDPRKAVANRRAESCERDMLLGRLVRSRDYLQAVAKEFSRRLRSCRPAAMMPGWP